MICKNCGTEFIDEAIFCPSCGTAANEPKKEPVMAQTSPQQPAPQQPAPQRPVYQQPVYQAPVQPMPPKKITEEDLPEEYRPLGAWTYFWLQILFAVPIVGFIFLIIFSFNGSNINRRSFARSYWCAYLIIGGLFLLLMIIGVATGASFLAAFDRRF